MKGVLGPNFFSREPLNYETLKRRCSQFHVLGVSNSLLIEDYIKANRRLQEFACKNKAENIDNALYGKNFLGIDLNISTPKLERDLWHFLQKHWKTSINNENVVKSYILDSKRSNIGNQFEIVTKHFHAIFRDKLEATGSTSSTSIQAFLRVLMQRNDYHNCFKLIDQTYNDPIVVAAKKTHIIRQSINAFIGSIGLATFGTGAAAFNDPSLAFTAFVAGLGVSSVVFAFVAFALGFLKSNCVDRIAWRLYVPIIHRYLNREHSAALNQIVTHFEENHDINSKNYHLRQDYDTVIRRVDDEYELISPNYAESYSSGDNSGAKKEAMIACSLLRSELSKRKLVWKPLKEETAIFEFWNSDRNNYEWVEPDQDPAEISFKTSLEKR